MYKTPNAIEVLINANQMRTILISEIVISAANERSGYVANTAVTPPLFQINKIYQLRYRHC
jgi:hypothetical protein